MIPLSKDVVCQLCRRAMIRASQRRERLKEKPPIYVVHYEVEKQISEWLTQWERSLILGRDHLLKARDQWETRKRHARDRARRGNKTRRRQ